MFYLAAYAFMNIGAFAVVTLPFAARASSIVSIDDFAGLGQTPAAHGRACSPSSCSR